MAKYIKELKLTNNNTFSPLTLNFKSGVNVIIGPKGGGKSTLIEFLNHLNKRASFNKNQLAKFKQFSDLKATELVYSNGDIVVDTQLTSKSKDVIIEDYISQDDDLKTNMHEMDSVLIEKNSFVEDLYLENKNVFEQDFINYVDSMTNILHAFNSIQPDFSMLSNLQVKENLATKLITRFEINIDIINSAIDEIIESNNMQINTINELINVNTLLDNKISSNLELNISNIFTQEDNKYLIEKIKKIEANIKDIKRLRVFLNLYNKTTKFIKNKNANEESLIQKSTRFKENLRNFIFTNAKLLAQNKYYFDKLYNNDTIVQIKKEKKGNLGLTFAIDAQLNIWNEINEGDSSLPMSKILESILYKPSKDERNFSNWIVKMIEKNGMKKNSSNQQFSKLKEEICKIISDNVEILYENQNYENLSLGQRTSLMLENKLKEIDETKILFLDQPEDNIDNHTIANVLVNIVNEKMKQGKLNQLFVVTHNANFGILLNPSSLTLASLSKNTDEDVSCWYNQYFSLEDIDANIDTFKSQQSYYLEGGNQILKKRYEKLVGINNDN